MPLPENEQAVLDEILDVFDAEDVTAVYSQTISPSISRMCSRPGHSEWAWWSSAGTLHCGACHPPGVEHPRWLIYGGPTSFTVSLDERRVSATEIAPPVNDKSPRRVARARVVVEGQAALD